MIERYVLRRLVLLPLSSALLLGCPEPGYERISASDAILDRVDEGRVTTLADSLHQLNPLFLLVRPASSSWASRMASPVAVSALGSPTCRVVVVDDIDQALHLFDFDGRYTHSVALAAGRARELSTVTGVTGNPQTGVITLYDATRDRVWRVGIDSAGPRITHAPPTDSILDDLSRVAVLPQLFSHASPETLEPYELSVPRSERLTTALNEGQLVVAGDMVWFARFADARVFQLARGRRRQFDLVRVTSLPLFFRMKRPHHDIVTGGGELPVALQRHLTAFGITDNDSFVFAQVVTPNHQWALTFMEMLTGNTVRIDVGRVWALASADNLIFVLESERNPVSWSRQREVKVYANPLRPDGEHKCRSPHRSSQQASARNPLR